MVLEEDLKEEEELEEGKMIKESTFQVTKKDFEMNLLSKETNSISFIAKNKQKESKFVCILLNNRLKGPSN